LWLNSHDNVSNYFELELVIGDICPSICNFWEGNEVSFSRPFSSEYSNLSISITLKPHSLHILEDEISDYELYENLSLNPAFYWIIHLITSRSYIPFFITNSFNVLFGFGCNFYVHCVQWSSLSAFTTFR
jgi:hypothetical protein